ncbi:hypothetical protein AB835_06215 [Candidatus Endobugula sertula]|uniref:Adenosylcobinamide-GDP ribazoletransferase n=1 Tax=Candidatus Endobugula sertula TaxID=62101 RepID=A0A1D2QQV0_9GAMM|nr:hypothetical protein AB835_06215 [Candidatus Endobugula sertula]
MSHYLLPFIIALTLMTRLPIYAFLPKFVQKVSWTENHYGLSVLWYPLVGVVLAVFISVVLVLLPNMPELVTASIAVTLLAVLTGGLHLDGLADAIDAGCAAHGQPLVDRKEKILRVLNEPTAGPMAIVALVLVLLLKIVLLSHISMNILWVLVVTLSVSRAMALLLLVTTPYIGEQGLGSALSTHSQAHQIYTVLGSLLLLLFIFLPIMAAFWILICSLSIVFFWRQFWMKSMGGMVGDCIGAVIELGEVGVLFILCLTTL